MATVKAVLRYGDFVHEGMRVSEDRRELRIVKPLDAPTLRSMGSTYDPTKVPERRILLFYYHRRLDDGRVEYLFEREE